MTPDPWERQPNDTDAAFRAFQVYRDQGDGRSLAKTVSALGRPEGYLKQLKDWSAKFGWVARARAWDDHLDHIKRQEAEKEMAEMGKRHARLAASLQQVLSLPISEVAKRLKQDPDQLSEIPTDKLLDMLTRAASAIKTGIDVERLSRGLETERLGITAGGGVSIVDLQEAWREAVGE